MSGTEIKQLRKSLNLTQESLGKLVGTNKHRVSDWERGKHKISGGFQKLLEQLKTQNQE